jgi:hypothetical protein
MARQELTAAEKETFTQLEPALDDALGSLSDKDRQAVLLHFYQGMSLDELAVEMGVSREGAKKRVYRAVEKLRGYFKRKGAAVSVPVLVAMLMAQGSEAATASLASTITATAAGMLAPSGMSTAITEGIVKSMCVGTSRLLRAVLAGQFAVAALIGGAVLWPESKNSASVAPSSVAIASSVTSPSHSTITSGTIAQANASQRSQPQNAGVALGPVDPAAPYDPGAHPFEAPAKPDNATSKTTLASAIAELLNDLPPIPQERALKASVTEDAPVESLAGAGGSSLPAWGELLLPHVHVRRFEFNQSSLSAGQVASAAQNDSLDAGLFTPTAPGNTLDPDLAKPITPGQTSPGSGSTGGLNPIDSKSVPEPGALGLLAMGALLAFRRRRRS